MTPPPPLINGHRYELELQVRPAAFTVRIDGVERGRFPYAGQPLSVVAPWKWEPGPDAPPLAVGSFQSPTRFEWVRWRNRMDE